MKVPSIGAIKFMDFSLQNWADQEHQIEQANWIKDRGVNFSQTLWDLHNDIIVKGIQNSAHNRQVLPEIEFNCFGLKLKMCTLSSLLWIKWLVLQQGVKGICRN